MSETYDPSWDLRTTNARVFERKHKEWQRRDWTAWLRDHLMFPFTIIRMEDGDGAYYTDKAKRQPFGIDHIMEVIGIDPEEDEKYGILIMVREGKHKGYVPLADVEVTSREDPNFWPVREYVVWFANRC